MPQRDSVPSILCPFTCWEWQGTWSCPYSIHHSSRSSRAESCWGPWLQSFCVFHTAHSVYGFLAQFAQKTDTYLTVFVKYVNFRDHAHPQYQNFWGTILGNAVFKAHDKWFSLPWSFRKLWGEDHNSRHYWTLPHVNSSFKSSPYSNLFILLMWQVLFLPDGWGRETWRG